MKNRRAAFTLILGVVLFSNGVFAQNQLSEMPAEERAKMQTARMASSLGLDSVQTVEVSGINLKYARKMDPVIQGNGSRISKFKAFNEINNQKEKDLKTVLSKEQFTLFKQQQEEMKKQIKQKRR